MVCWTGQFGACRTIPVANRCGPGIQFGMPTKTMWRRRKVRKREKKEGTKKDGKANNAHRGHWRATKASGELRSSVSEIREGGGRQRKVVGRQPEDRRPLQEAFRRLATLQRASRHLSLPPFLFLPLSLSLSLSNLPCGRPRSPSGQHQPPSPSLSPPSLSLSSRFSLYFHISSGPI